MMIKPMARFVRVGVTHEVTAPTLELESVVVSYPTRGSSNGARPPALEDISFRLEAGERVAVVGPNGAGKSTLLKLIAGMLKPDQGRVSIFGSGPSDHICIAYVPQRSQIDWSFPVTVEDVVMMGRVDRIGLFRWPRREDRDLVRASLERVGAADLAHKQIGELSGGQQQRVFIARALAQEAELLLMDEPLTGLDVRSRDAIFGILESLRADEVTILVSTHDLNQAAEHFDRIMLLNRRLVAFGPPASVLHAENLRSAYGGHVHVVNGNDEAVLLTDTCCDG
jgi:ABC-type Mn2+/Zn2+ transport system ATPase subunit